MPQEKKRNLGERPLLREQVYLCVMTNIVPPPSKTPARDELMHDHKVYLRDLERQGLLFGAGRLINSEDNEEGGGGNSEDNENYNCSHDEMNRRGSSCSSLKVHSILPPAVK